MKILDRITALFAVWLLCTLWLKFKFPSAIAAAMGAALALCAMCAYLLLKRRIRPLLRPRMQEVCDALALMGAQRQSEYFSGLLPPDSLRVRDGEFFRFEREGRDILVLCAFRFGDLTREDVAKVYRKCLCDPPDQAVILTRRATRDVLLFAHGLNGNICIPDRLSIYRALQKHAALPTLPKAERPRRVKLNWKDLPGVVFHPKRAKFYFLNGFLLALLSLFTPLKFYYLGIASVPLLFGVICAISPAISE